MGQKLIYHTLTEGQKCLLAHGPNFAIVPKCPPNGEYIAAVEQACPKLNQEEAHELRVEVRSEECTEESTTSQSQYQQGRDEGHQGIERGWHQVILTADKGVALVVMDKDDYIKKARRPAEPAYLVAHACWPLHHTEEQANQPTKNIKAEGVSVKEHTRECTPPGQDALSSMRCPRSTKQGHPLDPQFQAGALSPMALQKSWLRSWNL